MGDFTRIPGQAPRSEKKEKPLNKDGAKSDNRPTCSVCGKLGHKADVCWYRGKNSSNGSSSTYRSRPLTCFLCGQAGHKSIDCPEGGKSNAKTHNKTVKKEPEAVNIRKVTAVDVTERKNWVNGKVNGMAAAILVDSGADKEKDDT